MAKIKFLKPMDGDVLFENADGELRDGFLYTTVTLFAPSGIDIIFVKDDIILNEHTPDGINAYLDKISKDEDHCFMYLLIHEQYFYPHYESYLPDYRERLFRGVEWCERNGYRSSWISDFALEKMPGRD